MDQTRQGLWKRIDVDLPTFVDPGDECYFARDYVSHGGYKAGRANQLISNFKKPKDRQSTSEWYWKQKAVDRFAVELVQILPARATVVTIPTSKCKDDREYDPRFDMLAQRLKASLPRLDIQYPLTRIETCEAFHQGSSRNPSQTYGSLRWGGFDPAPDDQVFLVDDVITCGTHFKACKRHIIENHPNLQVIGLFWARTVWREDEENSEIDWDSIAPIF